MTKTTKNYTTAQRQKFYEKLLALNCPDLLASLIAKRMDKKFAIVNPLDEANLASFVFHGFNWSTCFNKGEVEGSMFWDIIHSEIEEKYYGVFYTDEGNSDVLSKLTETTDATGESEYQLLKADPEYKIVQTMPKAALVEQPFYYEIGDVVKSSAGENFIAIGTNFNLDKEVEAIKDNEVFGYVNKEEPELTFWQKIKFYAGRLFFKV